MGLNTLNNDYILYSLNVEDAQNVSNEILGRPLTVEELKKLQEKIGDCFLNWFDLMESEINDVIRSSSEDKIA